MDQAVRKQLIVAGVDPSAGSGKPSGLCVLRPDKTILFLGKWHTFEELETLLTFYEVGKNSVGIDGPLQPPHELDFCCFESKIPACTHRQTTPFKGRYCEYLLNRNGFRCFVTSRDSFAKLWMRRCFRLNEFLHSRGFRPMEVYPTAVRKILFPGITGKKQQRKSREELQTRLREWGIRFPDERRIYSHDELDAVLAAITVWLFHRGRTVRVGDERDGYIILPKVKLEYL